MMYFYSILKNLLLFLGLFPSVFFSILILRELADRHFRWISNDYILIDVVVFILTIALFTYIVLKKYYSIAFSLIGISLISYTTAGFLGAYFGNSELWYLKYLSGALTGIISLLVLRHNTHWKYGAATVLIALIATGVAEKAEYISVLDPPANPSLLYNFSPLFLSQILWIILLIVVPAYFFSQGFLVKRFFKK